MMNFLTTHWPSILTVIGFILVIAWLLRCGYADYVKKILFYLVTKAELEFGGGTGELKYAAVSTWVFERLPFVARFLLSAKEIDQWIECAVANMKNYLTINPSAEKLIK